MNQSMKHFLLVSCLVAGGAWHAFGNPSWWASRGVTANGTTNDYAAANAGQVKWMVCNAAAELDVMLPGGAGPEITALVAGFSATNNYLAVNVGQLKAVGTLFYDRLTTVGYATSYPWSATAADDADYALANIGQLKNVFNFDPGPGIAASAGSGGSISPSGTIWVAYGASTNFAVAPNAHYHITSVIVDGGSVGVTNAWTFANVTNAHTIQALFGIDQYTLTVSSLYGAPNPAGVTTNGWGTLLTPSLGGSPAVLGATQYVCTGFAGTGSATNGSGINTSFTLTTNSTLTWLWTTNYLLAPTSLSVNGSVNVAPGYVAEGSNVTITATASNGYHFVNWTGTVTTNANPLTVTMTQAYSSLQANFAINIYTITAAAGANGTINPDGNVQVPHFGQTNFLIQAATNAHIARVRVDGVSTGWFGPGSNMMTYIFNNVVTNHTISASFNTAPHLQVTVAPTIGAAPLMVSFDFGGSTDAETNIVRCEVDREGDGTTDASIDLTGKILLEYSQLGVYTTALHVVDAYGLIDTTNLTIAVTGLAPTAVVAATPTSTNVPFVVQFTGTNSTCAAGRQIILYEWDFDGDGQYDAQSHNGLATWMYRQSGTNFAVLRVTDSEGLQDVASIQITALPASLTPPAVSLVAQPTSGDLPLTVEFTATPSNASSVAEYGWDFDGDNQRDQVTTNNIVSHLYEAVGEFIAVVTVVDTNGLSAQASATVTVVEGHTWKVWITQPVQGTDDVAHISGNAVSVIGHVAPANDTVSVQFQYKYTASGMWTNLGLAVYSQPQSYSTTWDVTGLANGSNYNLRAVAVLDGGETATSDVYTVAIDTGSGNQEDNGSGKHEKTQVCSKDSTIEIALYDGTEVLIPEGAVTTNPIVTVELTGENTNGVKGSAKWLVNVDANRTVSLEGDPDLNRSITITIPYSDTNSDGIVDGTGLSEDSLTAHWYDTASGQWCRALSTEIDTEANRVKVKTDHLTEFGLFGLDPQTRRAHGLPWLQLLLGQ